MTVEEMKRIKREKRYTSEQLAELSGVPLDMVQKLFAEECEDADYVVQQALEDVLKSPFMVAETAMYAADRYKRQGQYTVEDYRALPEDERVELIDGEFIVMDAPNHLHQKIAGEIYRQIANFIMDNEGKCEPLISPVDVQLDCDEKTMVQPDIAILCDSEKIRRWGIYGAPDFILEIVSPYSRRKDYLKKLAKYENAHVREYWILDPYQRKLLVYFFESEICPVVYGMEQTVPINIYEGRLKINLKNIGEWIEEEKGYSDEKW